MIISHRGNGNHIYKENSKDAIKKVLKENYVDGVEIDIRFTKDKRMVLNHGATYNNKIIKYTNYDDLYLDSIHDIMKDIKTNKIILIEIKDNDFSNIQYILSFIKNYNYLNIYIQSFYKEILFEIKKRNKKIKIGLVCFNIPKDISSFDFISLWHSNYKTCDKELFVWTVNNHHTIKKFINLNVNIITDKPDIII